MQVELSKQEAKTLLTVMAAAAQTMVEASRKEGLDPAMKVKLLASARVIAQIGLRLTTQAAEEWPQSDEKELTE